MKYEEWRYMTRTVLNFYSLTESEKEQILLMIDGLKYRKLND